MSQAVQLTNELTFNPPHQALMSQTTGTIHDRGLDGDLGWSLFSSNTTEQFVPCIHHHWAVAGGVALLPVVTQAWMGAQAEFEWPWVGPDLEAVP